MAYRTTPYPKAGTPAYPKDYASDDVIVEEIPVRNGDINRPISVFIQASGAPSTSFKLQESVDGVDWTDVGPNAASYAGNWAVIRLKEDDFPMGVTVRAVATGSITVSDCLVSQAW